MSKQIEQIRAEVERDMLDQVTRAPYDVPEEAKKYADEQLLGHNRELAESGHTRHFKMGYVCFAGYEIEAAFADGMLAERERMASCPTIKGWVARDGSPVNAQDLNIGKLKIWPKVPYRNRVGLFWMPNFPQDFAIMTLPSDLFPDLRWEDEPKPVRVIIEEIKEAGK